MADIKEEVRETLAALEQQRDELRVQMHLAKAEAKDEWAALETKLERARNDAKKIGQAAGESAKDVGAAFKLLGEEIKRGYEKIRKQM